MSETAIKIENLKKKYRLGAIGGQTLNAELQSWWARKRGKEDPNLKIGQTYSDTSESFWALNGINLEIKKGEALGIIGANGAGKSTLLKILSRVTAPTEGDIWLNGRISSMLEVGTGFHQELTGRENIYMNGAILGMSRKEVDRKIESIIDFSECRQFIDTPVKRYSSGMYVKLAFAVASHLDSEILVMDEVLAVGDMNFQKKCLGKMGDAAENEGRTVLYVSHNMSTIRNLCTRCIVLNKGSVVFDGDVEKAIAVYSKGIAFEANKLRYEYDGLKRRTYLLGKSEYIHSIEFLNKEAAVFSDEETIRLRIIWSNNKILDELCFRLVIQQIDFSPIGMTETDILQQATTIGKHSTIIYFNTRNLTNGNYLLTVSLNCIHPGGKYDMRDEAPIPLNITICENHYLKENKSSWIGKLWGSVRFDKLETKSL